MNVAIRFILLYLAIQLVSCGKLCKDMKLSSERTDYLGTELRTSGYFYSDHSNSGSARLCYLYNNGVYLDCSSVDLKDAENGTIAAHIIDSPPKDTKRAWGTFRISGTKIEIEGWQPTLGCSKTMLQKGEIINDSTFVITRIEYMKKNGKVDRVDTTSTVFHFHAADRKPDSTTNFVK
jgi:hypothetical protein